MLCFILVAQAIPGEAENRLDNYCCIYAEKALSALDPLLRGHSQASIQLKKLWGMLTHLLPTGCDILRSNVDHFASLQGRRLLGGVVDSRVSEEGEISGPHRTGEKWSLCFPWA